VRFLVRDDVKQNQRVVALLRRGAVEDETFSVGESVRAEVVWVLASRYRCTRDEISAVVRQLAEGQELLFDSTDRVVRALRAFEKGRGASRTTSSRKEPGTLAEPPCARLTGHFMPMVSSARPEPDGLSVPFDRVGRDT
jgi:predicted nucleic-acid-binding protein